MKTTFELPDDLLAEVKVEAARQTRQVEELLPELVRVGLLTSRRAGLAPDLTDPTNPTDRMRALQSAHWLEDWMELGATATKDRPEGPTATEILAAHRRRLDRS